MTIMLRDLPDGQVEIVLHRPEVIGVMRDHEIAARFVAFLQEEDSELKLTADATPVELDDDIDAIEAAAGLDDNVIRVARVVRTPPIAHGAYFVERSNVPGAVAFPKSPALRAVERVQLTDEQRDAAFGRIQAGETIASVAPDYGLTMGQLRGAWANHRRLVQQHIAASGQVACKICTKSFTPSISHPETCARCSHE